VTYLDGRVDTLSLAEARRIIDTPIDSTATQQRQGTSSYGYHHAGLGNVLLYGSMGYMLGRSFNQPVSPGVYASPQVFNRSTQHANVVRNLRRIPSHQCFPRLFPRRLPRQRPWGQQLSRGREVGKLECCMVTWLRAIESTI
jgi:hypothetical protein